MCVIDVNVKTVTTREVQHHFAKVLKSVQAGEEVKVTRRGKTVAMLVPVVGDEDAPLRIPNFGGWRESVGISSAGGGNSVVEMRRED